jgi:hypothetical protein
MQVFISKDDRQCAGPEYFLWRAGGGTVVLWTATDAVVWRPPSEAMELLQQPIAPDAVLHAVTTIFK